VIGGTGTVSGSGISISSAGKRAIVHGNYVKEYWGYGIEVIGEFNVVTSNTIDTCTNDRLNTLFAMSVGGSINAHNSIIHNNAFINIVNKVYSHVALNVHNSLNVSVQGNHFVGVSAACQISSGTSESVTFANNVHSFDDGSGGVGLAYWTFAATAGTKHVVVHNVTRGIGALPAAGFYKFGQNFGGYYDFTSGQHIHGAAGFLEFGASSANLAIA
jgi:hypothetical protein